MELEEAGPNREGGESVVVRLSGKEVALDIIDINDIKVNKARDEKVETLNFIYSDNELNTVMGPLKGQEIY